MCGEWKPMREERWGGTQAGTFMPRKPKAVRTRNPSTWICYSQDISYLYLWQPSEEVCKCLPVVCLFCCVADFINCYFPTVDFGPSAENHPSPSNYGKHQMDHNSGFKKCNIVRLGRGRTNQFEELCQTSVLAIHGKRIVESSIWKGPHRPSGPVQDQANIHPSSSCKLPGDAEGQGSWQSFPRPSRASVHMTKHSKTSWLNWQPQTFMLVTVT